MTAVLQCSQCRQAFTEPACGFAHAMIAAQMSNAPELAQLLTTRMAEVERERDEIAVNALHEIDKISGQRDAAKRRVRAAELLHVWTNEDGKRFVFADDLAAALEIPGADLLNGQTS